MMKKLRLIFIPLFVFIVFAASAQESTRSKFAYSGFSGGMMVHTGYLYGGSISPATDAGCNCLYDRKMEGMPFGIGGAARVHFGEHLRVGTEGYVSTLNYGGRDNDSFARLGWGGVLADCIWQLGKWAPYIGGTVGGGGFKNLTLQNETPLDYEVEQNASFRNYSFFVITPFAGVEYALTDKIRLNMKADWVFNVSNRWKDFPVGPRIYFGFSFYRMKDK